MESSKDNIVLLSTFVIFLITFFLIFLFVFFQNRKNKLLQEKIDSKKQFEKEIAETQIEIREQTLKNISWELHDNIGQLLTLAKIQLQSRKENTMQEVEKTISKSLQEIRSLSKLINPDTVINLKLSEVVQLEVNRFNRIEYIQASVTISGREKKINPKHHIVLFRILQEFFTNTIKHSKATTLRVHLQYTKSQLEISAKDNGIGFNTSLLYDGIGLSNIKNRAKLIDAKLKITSKANSGTEINILYTY